MIVPKKQWNIVQSNSLTLITTVHEEGLLSILTGFFVAGRGKM